MVTIESNATISFYGDSILDYRSFGTVNSAINRALAGSVRFAENATIDPVADLRGRPGWDLAIAGTTVSEITQRFLALVPHDEADIVVVLLGANNYGSAGPGSGTAQDWIDRVDEIVAATAAADKILVLLPPLSHRSDPISGREALKDYLPTLASDRVIVPDTAGFDQRLHTDDGVHPNPLGSEVVAAAVVDALAARLPGAYDFSRVGDTSLNIARNGALNGTGGALVGGAAGGVVGSVAANWALDRITGTGTVTGSKVVVGGNEGQQISYTGKGLVRLSQSVTLNGRAGEQYEVAFRVSVDDPNRKFLGVWARDADTGDGVRLFDSTVVDTIDQSGTGSFSATLRSPKFTLIANENQAIIDFNLFFDEASGARATIFDVQVIKVADAPPGYVPPGIITATLPSEDAIITTLLQSPTTVTLSAAANNYSTLSREPLGLTAGDGNDTVAGNSGNDTIAGERGDDRLTGNSGSDVLLGGFGNDTLSGGADNDRLLGGEGNDLLQGSTGNDRLEGGSDEDTLQGGDGDDTLFGNDGHDVLQAGGGANELHGNDGNDALTAGGSDANLLFGDAGNDTLTGGGGNDRLNGGTGDDRLSGGNGRDSLTGGTGADQLSGGTGADIFFIGEADAIDSITDFRRSDGDLLDLGGAGVDTVLTPIVVRGAVAADFALVSGAALGGADLGPGFVQLWSFRSGVVTHVIGDLNDNRVYDEGDFVVTLRGSQAPSLITAADVVGAVAVDVGGSAAAWLEAPLATQLPLV